MVLRLVLVLFAILQLIQVESDAEQLQLPHISTDLLVESKEVRPGDVAVLGLSLKPEAGWHIYWKNPGDSGASPKFRWDLQSTALKLSATHWPVPERFATKHLVNFGYGHPTAILFDLQVDPRAKLGDQLTVDLEAELLICKDECIPVQAQFRQIFNVVDGVSVTPDEFPNEAAELFSQVRRRLPQLAAPGLVKVTVDNDKVLFDLSTINTFEVIDLFPSQRGVFSNTAPERVSNKQLSLERLKGRDLPPVLEGVLIVSAQGRQEAYDISVSTGDNGRSDPIAAASTISLTASDSKQQVTNIGELSTITDTTKVEPEPQPAGLLPRTLSGFLGAVVFALLGGLILNLMPCVLPVLGLKLFEIIEGRTHGGKGMRRDAVAYTAGVVFSMWVLAAILLVFRGGAEQLGWGFQLQSPIFVALMALIIFTLGLSFVGLLEVPTPTFVARAKITGPFSSGVLATLLATPCTAPFMGTALAYALTRSVGEAFVVFSALGLGIALPYLLVAFIPALARVLPRPGAWMILIKELLAFPLFATVLWLLWVLGNQAGIFAVIAVAAGCLLLSLAGWLLHRARMSINRGFVRVARGLAALVVIVALAVSVGPLGAETDAVESRASEKVVTLDWSVFSQQRVNELIDSGRPVFVDFTAEWCITCKVNEKFVLSQNGIKQAFKERDFAMVKADWTDGNPEIGLALKRLGRQGVPVYVFYRKRNGKVEHRVLPTLLTPGIVRNAIEEFGS